MERDQAFVVGYELWYVVPELSSVVGSIFGELIEVCGDAGTISISFVFEGSLRYGLCRLGSDARLEYRALHALSK